MQWETIRRRKQKLKRKMNSATPIEEKKIEEKEED